MVGWSNFGSIMARTLRVGWSVPSKRYIRLILDHYWGTWQVFSRRPWVAEGVLPGVEVFGGGTGILETSKEWGWGVGRECYLELKFLGLYRYS